MGAERPGEGTGFYDTGFYDIVHRRRDVRGEFSGDPVDPVVLRRILDAAHSAPSVGLSQPWDFVVVTDDEIRTQFWRHVQSERAAFAETLESEQAEKFAGIRIDGIVDASLSLVVTYDERRGSPAVLGRHSIADAGLYSVCLAVQNLWLACTAEGWGMGWVSFFREDFLRELVGIPEVVRPVAWLCMGPVSHLQSTPDLERHGWRTRLPLESVLHANVWGNAWDVDDPQGDDVAGEELLRSGVSDADGSVGPIGGRIARSGTDPASHIDEESRDRTRT
jgi:5,6-dimethylbenzimidazole synthase